MAAEYRDLARKHLDARLATFRTTQAMPPPSGWIRSVRDALGMSSAELASRLGVTPQQISQYEAAERSGTIKLQTLQRVAEALGGSLRYALVTELPMDAMVMQRARDVAARELAAVDHSMALEKQLPDRDEAERLARLERRAAELIDAPRLWADDR